MRSAPEDKAELKAPGTPVRTVKQDTMNLMDQSPEEFVKDNLNRPKTAPNKDIGDVQDQDPQIIKELEAALGNKMKQAMRRSVETKIAQQYRNKSKSK